MINFSFCLLYLKLLLFAVGEKAVRKRCCIKSSSLLATLACSTVELNSFLPGLCLTFIFFMEDLNCHFYLGFPHISGMQVNHLIGNTFCLLTTKYFLAWKKFSSSKTKQTIVAIVLPLTGSFMNLIWLWWMCNFLAKQREHQIKISLCEIILKNV